MLSVARAGVEAGCTEALFTLGDKPELVRGLRRRYSKQTTRFGCGAWIRRPLTPCFCASGVSRGRCGAPGARSRDDSLLRDRGRRRCAQRDGPAAAPERGAHDGGGVRAGAGGEAGPRRRCAPARMIPHRVADPVDRQPPGGCRYPFPRASCSRPSQSASQAPAGPTTSAPTRCGSCAASPAPLPSPLCSSFSSIAASSPTLTVFPSACTLYQIAAHRTLSLGSFQSSRLARLRCPLPPVS